MPLLGLAAFLVAIGAAAWWLSRADDFWTRLAAIGLLLVPLALVVQAAAGNVVAVFGSPIPLVAAALVAGAVLESTKRFYVPALVLAVLLTLTSLALGFFGLTHPDSFGDFAPAVLSLGGSVLAIVGTAKAIRSRRRTGTPTAAARSTVLTGAGVLAAIGITSAVQTLLQPAVGRPAGAELVVMHRDVFVPNSLRVAAGDRISVFIRNDDSYAHTFTVDELGVDEYVGPRRGKRIDFTVPTGAFADGAPSRLDIVCTVTGHDEMRGTLEVAP